MRQIRLLLAATLLAVGAITLWYLIGRFEHSISPIRLSQTAHPQIKYLGQMRIAAYNIAHGRGGELGASNWSNQTPKQLYDKLDAIAVQINQLAPDVIVLNEIDFMAAWSFNIDQADYLAQKCGYRYVLKQRNLGVSLPFYQLHFGNALLSKFPIENIEFLRFTPYSAIENLAAGNHDGFITDIILPSGSIAIVGAHLEYRDEHTRVEAAKVIAHTASKREHPVIALGDFNSSLNTPTNVDAENTIRLLLDDGYIAGMPGNKAPDTFPSNNPERKIDWILGRGVNFLNAKAIPSPNSDHLMIVAEVQSATE